MLGMEHMEFVNSVIAVIHEMLERDDQINAAYQWLDAQATTRTPLTETVKLPRLIGDWSGLDISDRDVAIAAVLHPSIREHSPFITIDSRFTLPSTERLWGISASFTFNLENGPVVARYHYYEAVIYLPGKDAGVVGGFERKLLPEISFDVIDFCGQHANCECYYCVYGR